MDDQRWRWSHIWGDQTVPPPYYDIGDKEVVKELKKRGVNIKDIPEECIIRGYVATKDLDRLVSAVNE